MADVSASDQLRVELGYLRDNLVDAIAAGRARAVDDGLETYEHIVEAVLAVAADVNPSVSNTTGSDPLVFARLGLGDAPELQWIGSDFVDLSEAAAQAGHRAILFSILNLPIALAEKALVNRDLRSMGNLLRLLEYGYDVVAQLPSGSLRKLTTERIRFRLEEFSNYHVVRGLESASDDELAFWAGGIVVIFTVYSRLFKAAFDLASREPSIVDQQIDDFNHLVVSLGDSYPQLERRAYQLEPPVWNANAAVERAATNEARVVAEAARDRARLRRETWKVLHQYQRSALAGMSAWVLHELNADRLGTTEAVRWLAPGPHASTLVDAFERYGDAVASEGAFGWDWWITERSFDGRRISSGYGYAYSDVLALWLAVEVLRISEPGRPPLPFDITEETDYLMSDQGPLLRHIDSIGGRETGWEPIVGADVAGRISAARGWIAEAQSRWNREQEEELLATAVSEERVQRLRTEISTSWRDATSIRRLISSRRGLVTAPIADLASSAASSREWLLPKGGFVDGGHAVTVFSSDFGLEMAAREDEVAFETLVAALVHVRQASPESAGSILVAACTTLRGRGFEPAILLPGRHGVLQSLAGQPDFRFVNESGDVSPIARIADYPIFGTLARSRSEFLVADLRKVAEWRQGQFPVDDAVSEDQFLRIEANAISETDAEAWLAGNPDVRLGADATSHGDKVRILRGQIILRVSESFELRVVDETAGTVVTLGEPADGGAPDPA